MGATPDISDYNWFFTIAKYLEPLTEQLSPPQSLSVGEASWTLRRVGLPEFLGAGPAVRAHHIPGVEIPADACLKEMPVAGYKLHFLRDAPEDRVSGKNRRS